MGLVSRIYDSIEYIFAGAAYYISQRGHRMLANLTPLENISQLSPIVCRVLGQNPGPFTLQGTNTYLVGTGNEKVLIDAGEPNIVNYIINLNKALNRSKISCIIATHYHNDHVGGIPDVLRLYEDAPKIPVYKMRGANRTPEENAHLFQYVEDGHEINVEGATLKMIYTPGHTSDHAAVYLKEENAIFSGDCILGEGSSVFEDLHSYMTSLNILQQMNLSRIYPGHGPTTDFAQEKIAEYISHRMKREHQVLKALQSLGEDGASAAAITRIVYPNVSLPVRLGAIGNVRQHLKKLVKDGHADEVSADIYKYAIKVNAKV